jgi:hypothetical protein
MERVYVAVRLKSPDPGAATALSTLRLVMPECAPVQLSRYDLWEFDMKPGASASVPGMISHFTDIVNPNKHQSFILTQGQPPPGENPGLRWTGVLVRDHSDSRSMNWSRLLPRRGFPVSSVRWGVLWRFGFGAGPGDIDALAMKASLSESRDSGLLANPVSQEALPWK